MSQITEPGLYPDISNEDYHADPCPEPSLSSSLAKLIVSKTAAHARLAHPKLNPDHEPVVSNQFDLGSVAHSMMLHDERDIVVLDYDAYRTNAAKAERDEARANDKIPILAAQYETACAMVRSGRAQLDRHEEAWEAFRKGYGQPEQTVIWRDGPENFPIWCRMRLDWKPNNGNVFWDYKTTGGAASPQDWARTMLNTGADVQSGFYRRGIAKQLGIEDPHFRFVVQETEPPYALAVHELDPFFNGVAFRKADAAITSWAWCLKTGHWPGYVGRVHYLECPTWEANKWEDRNLDHDDQELLEISLRWQAPDAATEEAAANLFRGENK